MAFEPSIAVFDSCILYPFHLRNIVVQAAVDRLVEARWTDEIHDEWMRNLMVQVPAIPMERLPEWFTTLPRTSGWPAMISRSVTAQCDPEHRLVNYDHEQVFRLSRR
jgi:hypothetical protein